MDDLYDECGTVNSILHHLTPKEDWAQKGTAERWLAVLRGREADLPNILAVVSFVFSIPSSTGYVERVFSLMKNKWSDVRSRCSVDLIKSELMVTLNYDKTCPEFYKAALVDGPLLAAARSNKKYKWKK